MFLSRANFYFHYNVQKATCIWAFSPNPAQKNRFFKGHFLAVCLCTKKFETLPKCCSHRGIVFFNFFCFYKKTRPFLPLVKNEKNEKLLILDLEKNKTEKIQYHGDYNTLAKFQIFLCTNTPRENAPWKNGFFVQGLAKKPIFYC